MIIAVVQFPMKQPLSREQAAESFQAGAPKFQTVPGLLRKHYLRSEDGGTGGGVYLWDSKEAAEALYNDAWRERMTEKFGPPKVEFFESPVMVDPDVIMNT